MAEDYSNFNNYFKEKERERTTYRSKEFAHILDTKYCFNVPYLMNVEKYKALDSRMSDESIRTVKISYEKTVNHVFDDYTDYTIFVFTNDYDSERDNAYYHYDCFQLFNNSKESFEKLLRKIVDCIEDVDNETINKEVNKLIEEKNKIEQKIVKLSLFKNENI